MLMFLAESGLKVFFNPMIFSVLQETGDSLQAWRISIMSLLVVFFSYYIFDFNVKGLLSKLSLETTNARIVLYSIISISLFVVLAVKGLGLSKWIEDSRYAYQHGREGLGVFYVFSQFFAYLSIYAMCNRDKRVYKLLPIWLFYFSFYGSKRSLISVLLIPFFVRERSKGKIKPSKVIFLALLAPVLFVLSFLSGGGELSGIISYFNYFSSSAQVVEKIGSNFYHGKVLLSHFWSLVPRSFYPDKPSYHGSAYVTEILYPGMTEKGHFVGSLYWTEWYLDFGLLGVLLGSVFLGAFLKYFLRLMENSSGNAGLFIAFGIVITPVLKHVPWWFFMLIVLILARRNYESIKR